MNNDLFKKKRNKFPLRHLEYTVYVICIRYRTVYLQISANLHDYNTRFLTATRGIILGISLIPFIKTPSGTIDNISERPRLRSNSRNQIDTKP